MACECIETVDKLLATHNTRLGLTFVFSTPVSELPTLVVEQIEKGRGKPKAVTMFPSFCPFCGTKYKGRRDQGSGRITPNPHPQRGYRPLDGERHERA